MAESTFWSDFKKFITRGNVLDLAVGVVIGGSFGKITTGLVNYIINPFVGLFLKEGQLDTIRTVITEAELDAEGNVVTPEVAILWGSWFQTILDFLIVSLCIFIVLRILMKFKNSLEAEKLAEARKKADEQAAKDAEDKKAADEAAKASVKKQAELEAAAIHREKLLEEIRDLLKNKQQR